jgi:hypothetical protein
LLESLVSVRALLVFPELPPTYWSMTHALPFIGTKASVPPPGRLTVASLAASAWEMALVDMNVKRLSEAAVSAADLACQAFSSYPGACSEFLVKGSHSFRTPRVVLFDSARKGPG